MKLRYFALHLLLRNTDADAPVFRRRCSSRRRHRPFRRRRRRRRRTRTCRRCSDGQKDAALDASRCSQVVQHQLRGWESYRDVRQLAGCVHLRANPEALVGRRPYFRIESPCSNLRDRRLRCSFSSWGFYMVPMQLSP